MLLRGHSKRATLGFMSLLLRLDRIVVKSGRWSFLGNSPASLNAAMASNGPKSREYVTGSWRVDET
jgi:hypothetical protein